MTTLLHGHTVSGIRSPAMRRTSSGSSTIATPWSIRSAPRTSRAIAMFDGPAPTASPAWNVRRKPWRRAAANAGWNARKSTPSSVESAADPDDALGASGPPQLAQRLDQLEARLGPVGAVHVADQRAADAGGGLGPRDPLGQPGDDLAEVLAGREVARRREEHLAVAEAVGVPVDRGTPPRSAPSRRDRSAAPARARRSTGTSRASRSGRARWGRRPAAAGRPCARARATVVDRTEPSTWQCSSTFGIRSHALPAGVGPSASRPMVTTSADPLRGRRASGRV